MKNLYPGVNPHFNSRLQSPDGFWSSFHNLMIIQIADILDEVLPGKYFVLPELSLHVQPIPKTRRKSLYTPGKGLLDGSSYKLVDNHQPARSQPVLTLPVSANFQDEYPHKMGIVVYCHEAGEKFSHPVAYIELLSPAVKLGGDFHAAYRFNRCDALEAELTLIEIDLLHESPPIIDALPKYSMREDNAHPYWVLVSDPRPNLMKGKIESYGFDVAQPLPTVRVPLKGDDETELDLNEAYQLTFNRRAFYLILTDYHQRPDRFETYAPADQDFIIRRMAEIAAEQRGYE